MYNQKARKQLMTAKYGVIMEDNNIKVIETEESAVETVTEPISEPEKETSKKDQKITKKDILISLGIVIGVAILTVAIILSCVFGIAHTKAGEQVNVEMSEGEEWGKTYLCAWLNNRNDLTNENLDLPNGTLKYDLVEIELKKFDKDLKVERPIEESHYIYTYTFTVRNEKYAVVMDSNSGNILSVEIED